MLEINVPQMNMKSALDCVRHGNLFMIHCISFTPMKIEAQIYSIN